MSDGPDPDAKSVDYNELVGAMGDGVYALDADGEFIDFNEPLVRMAGYDEADIRETGPSLWHDDADMARFEAAIQEMLEDGGPATVNATMHTEDGPVPIEVTMSPLPSEAGTYRGHIGVVRDVTERRQREQELKRYETIVRAMPDEVYTLDDEGYFTSLIPPTGSAIATSGYTPEELVGEHVSIVMDEEDIARGREAIRQLIEEPDREKISFEMDVIAKDGRRIPNENHIALLPSPDEEAGFLGTVGVLRDISERKAREEALERQNQRLEEFADVVSHDLRNPLNVAMGHVELLRADYDDDRLDRVGDAHERMATIVEDVLALAREGQVVQDPAEVSLRAVADAAWSTVDNAEATLTIETDVSIRADGDRLQRLFENLYRNAIDHVCPDVSVWVGELPPSGSGTGFYVADDGPGIDADEREFVFESGHTTHEEGTGLGLAIVTRIADAHGWTVDVGESEAGGARFEITGVEVL